MQLSDREKRLVLACFDAKGGGDFNWRESGAKVGLSPEEADDLALMLADKGVFTALAFGHTACFSSHGRELARALDDERKKAAARTQARKPPPAVDPSLIRFVASGIEEDVQAKIQEQVNSLSTNERLYMLALSAFAEQNSRGVYSDIRQVIPEPDRTILESLKRKRFVTQWEPARPHFWHLTPEGLRLIPALNKWAADEKEKAAKDEQARREFEEQGQGPVRLPTPEQAELWRVEREAEEQDRHERLLLGCYDASLATDKPLFDLNDAAKRAGFDSKDEASSYLLNLHNAGVIKLMTRGSAAMTDEGKAEVKRLRRAQKRQPEPADEPGSKPAATTAPAPPARKRHTRTVVFAILIVAFLIALFFLPLPFGKDPWEFWNQSLPAQIFGGVISSLIVLLFGLLLATREK